MLSACRQLEHGLRSSTVACLGCGGGLKPAGLPSLRPHAVHCYSSGTSEPQVRQHRAWRWGATKGGLMSQTEAVEISEEPTMLEDFYAVTAVACGSNHSAFVSDGCLYTYGSNKYSQLGREEPQSSSSGLQPGKVTIQAEDGHCPAVLHLALGAFHSAAVAEGGTLWTWGWGGSFWYGGGALGHGNNTTLPEPHLVQRFVEAGEEVRQVACGSQHTIVLTAGGRVYTTGKGDFGRLGRGETRDELEFEEVEYFAQSNDSVLNPSDSTALVKVDAGNNFSAALSTHGELWLWGRNDFGQLGLGEEMMGDMYSAARYPRLVRSLPLEGHQVLDFACGEHHVVALTTAGAIYEWGNRTWLEPRPITLPSQYEEGLKNIVKVQAGEKVSFALTDDGRLYSWGSKSTGCLAQGKDCAKTLIEPTLVPPETFNRQKVVDIAASKFRCMVITSDTEIVA